MTRDPTAAADSEVEALYQAMRRDLVRLAAFLVDDRGLAEEIVQDAFAALYRHWHNLADSTAAAAYVRACVVNAARSEIRRRVVRRRRVGWRPVAVDTESAESTVLLAAEHRMVVDAVRALPRRQREVVVLRYWQGLSEAEIADTLGISAGSVKSAASRGLDAVERYVQRRNR
jgi:RNA polymerase sigma-70 factor (sigma-E family)